MMNCPQCGTASSLECTKCNISSEADTTQEQPAATAAPKDWDSLTTADRLAFSGRVLLLFVFVGPAIAALGIGESPRASEWLFILPVLYLIGSFIALCTWVLFSLIFISLAAIEKCSHTPISSMLSMLIITTFVAGLSGYFVWAVLGCSLSGWVLGGFSTCLKVVLYRDYAVSVLPGALCGLLSVLFWHNDLPSLSFGRMPDGEV